MATGMETGRRAGRALARAKGEVERCASELAERARKAAHDAGERMDRSRARAGPEGWRPARIVAGAAGVFLLFRGVLGALGGIPAAIAGLAVLSRVFPQAVPWGTRRRSAAEPAAGGGARRGSPEVIEVKTPAEMEQGIASGSPEPTSASRGGRRVPPPTTGEGS